MSSSLGYVAGEEAADLQLTPTPLPDDGTHPTSQPVHNNLPALVPITNPQFRLGELDAPAFTSLLDTTYKEVVDWKRNCFPIPKGNTGKAFVNELARLFAAFASGSTLQSVSLKATVVLPHVVLQKPYRSSKPKDHALSLERRMKLWEQGDLTELLKEGRAIRKRFSSSRHQGDEQQVAHSTLAALQLLTDQGKGGLFHLHDPVTPHSTVKDVLKSKHPPSNPASPECYLFTNTVLAAKVQLFILGGFSGS